MARKKTKTVPADPMPDTSAVIGYARVSTAEQNLDMQVQALKRAECHRIVTEKVSAVSDRRPALENALSMLRDGDTFVVWRLDRLARSLTDLLRRVQYIEDCGAKLKSLTESIDTATPGGRLLFHVLGALAQFERDLIQERTRSGMKAARERGIRLGALPKQNAAEHKAMQKDRNSGMSIRQIGMKYHVSGGTVQKWTTPPPNRRR